MKEVNKTEIGRRGFLKTAILAGAAFTMPAGLNRAAAKTNRVGEDRRTACIRGSRVLGTGAVAFEVSALGFGVMGMTYNRSQHPDKKQCVRLLHEAVDRGVTLSIRLLFTGR